jgi:GMP synthase (glutamine-hydrolysing)
LILVGAAGGCETASVRVLAIVHQRDAGPGVFADVVRSSDAELDFWMPAEQPVAPRELRRYNGVLTLGGAMHVDQEASHPWLRKEKEILHELLDRGVPLLGVCLGAQLVAEAAGARPRRASQPEIGWLEVELTAEAEGDPLLAKLPPSFQAFQWHSYEFPLPPHATPLARSPVCLQAFRAGDSAWGLQFHAEVSRAIVEDWARDYRRDEDAVRTGLDPEALREQTQHAIGRWNELGRGLCECFLARIAKARYSGVT